MKPRALALAAFFLGVLPSTALADLILPPEDPPIASPRSSASADPAGAPSTATEAVGANDAQPAAAADAPPDGAPPAAVQGPPSGGCASCNVGASSREGAVASLVTAAALAWTIARRGASHRDS